MMRIFTAFISLFIALLRLFGVTGELTPMNEYRTDYEGVYITIESIDGKSQSVEVLWHNESDSTVTFGMGHSIEYLNGDSWEDVQITDFAVIEIACMLDPGESGYHTYSTEYFNMLRAGVYRIRCEFYVTDSEAGACSTYALFDVKY